MDGSHAPARGYSRASRPCDGGGGLAQQARPLGVTPGTDILAGLALGIVTATRWRVGEVIP